MFASFNEVLPHYLDLSVDEDDERLTAAGDVDRPDTGTHLQ